MHSKFKLLLPLALNAAMACSALAGSEFGGPDQFGGYATDHIIVRYQNGITPINLPYAGPATFVPSIDGNTMKWGAKYAQPLSVAGYKNGALASKLGLDRTYLLFVDKGTDVKQMVKDLNETKGVDFAELDGIGGIALTPNDPQVSNCWGLNNTGQTGGTPDADIDAFEAWDTWTGNSSVVLAVLDTGVDGTHPELAGKMTQGRNTYDNTDNTTDDYGHGSHVSGTAGAWGNNNVGLAGVNWAVTIMPVRVLKNGSGTEAQCGAGMIWAADHGANICTMSLQYYTGSQTFRDGVDYAFNSGVLLIAATGNNQGRNVAYPAKFANCYGIGATTHTDAIASFSNYGPETDVSAPGENVYSLWLNKGYTYLSGTSMATPHTSGLASLIWSFDRGLKNVEVFDIIRATAEDKGAQGFDEKFGWGRINANFAIQKALASLAYSSSFNVLQGEYVSGANADLAKSDDKYLSLRQSPASLSKEPVQVQINATLPSPVGIALGVDTEVAGGTGLITQNLYLYNWDAGVYELVDTRTGNTADSFKGIRITNNPGRFVDSGLNVRAKLGYAPASPQVSVLQIKIDEASFALRN